MKQYEIFELTLKGEEPQGSHVDVNVEATFTCGGNTTTVKGFYAGNGAYKVRFLPEEIGEVSYRVSGNVDGQNLLLEGTEHCEKASEGRHGIVRADGVHLKNADGTWFHSFGTTVYALAHQNQALTEQTFETLSQNPFNKIRMCVFPKHYDYNVNDPEFFPFELNEGMTYEYDPDADTFASSKYLRERAALWDVEHPCFAFWDAFEEKVKRLDTMGIQVDLILFHPYDRWGFAFLTKEQNKIYLDYVMRRLAAMPNIWWSLANEYDFCSAKSLEDWYEIEEFVAQNDSYHHLLSNHNCFKTYDFNRKNITHCSIQKRTMTLVPELMQETKKPVLYDECVYEGNLKQNWGAINGEEMMNRFWKVTCEGGYCTHGEVFLDMDMENIQDAVLWWAKGGKLTGSSPARIAFLRSIIEEINQPLSPYVFGFAKLIGNMGSTDELPEEIRENMPATFLKVKDYQDMRSDVEATRQDDSEKQFAGCAGDDAFLFYYGTDCSARVDIEVPTEHTYKIEMIDAWNMTREEVATGMTGTFEVKLTGRPYMAVLATRE